jgi:circadian clock protein KaiC
MQPVATPTGSLKRACRCSPRPLTRSTRRTTPRTTLAKFVDGYGWSLDAPGIKLFNRSPSACWSTKGCTHCSTWPCRSTLAGSWVDSLGDLLVAAGDELRFREYMNSLIQGCARMRISFLMTPELADLFGVTRLSEFGVSHLADNVVLLQYIPVGDHPRCEPSPC